MLGMGTGEFIMECRSDSLKACDGLVTLDDGACGPSMEAVAALAAISPAVAGWGRWLVMEDRLAEGSALPLDGCDDGRRSLMVWNLESSSWRVVVEEEEEETEP